MREYACVCMRAYAFVCVCACVREYSFMCACVCAPMCFVCLCARVFHLKWYGIKPFEVWGWGGGGVVS